MNKNNQIKNIILKGWSKKIDKNVELVTWNKKIGKSNAELYITSINDSCCVHWQIEYNIYGHGIYIYEGKSKTFESALKSLITKFNEINQKTLNELTNVKSELKKQTKIKINYKK